MAKPISQPRAPGKGKRMTYEEFLAWADEDTRAEWVDGDVVMNSPVSLRHEQITTFLIDVLSQYARLHELGTVVGGPFQMKLAHSGREPDVLYVAKGHEGRLRDTFLDGPADLVVEVISPESVTRDRQDKFAEYQAAGIPEYWLLDPQPQQAEFYQLDTQGRYQLVPLDARGIYHSRTVPGFWLQVDWLWQDPLPDAVATLLKIDRAAYAAYLREQLRLAGEEGQG
jgi:Uma2 family endonuclease